MNMKTKTAGTLASIGLLASVFSGCATTGHDKSIIDIPATAADGCVESEIDAQIYSAWNKGMEPPLTIDGKLFVAIKNHCNEVYGDLGRHKDTTGIEVRNFFDISSPTLREEIGRVLLAPYKAATPE